MIGPIRPLVTWLSSVAGAIAALGLWRALIALGRERAEHAETQRKAEAERETHRRIDNAVDDARSIDRDDRARWLREYAERARGGDRSM